MIQIFNFTIRTYSPDLFTLAQTIWHYLLLYLKYRLNDYCTVTDCLSMFTIIYYNILEI